MHTVSKAQKVFGVKALNAALIVALLGCFSVWATEAQAQDEEVRELIAEAERAAQRGPYAADGTFEGTARGYGGPITMQVRIDNGYIDDVRIVDASLEDDAWLDMCLGLPENIVKAQSSSLDVISGATFTSAGILNATTEALQQSLEEGAQ